MDMYVISFIFLGFCFAEFKIFRYKIILSGRSYILVHDCFIRVVGYSDARWFMSGNRTLWKASLACLLLISIPRKCDVEIQRDKYHIVQFLEEEEVDAANNGINARPHCELGISRVL